MDGKFSAYSAPSRSHRSARLRPRGKKKTVRIMIADCHPIFRAGFHALLDAERDFRVVGEATSGDAVLPVALKCMPDILLLDITTLKLIGGAVLNQLSEAGLQVRTLVLTTNVDLDETVQAINLGASGVVPKNSTSNMLFEGIRRIVAGEYWLPPDFIAILVHQLRDSSPRPTSRISNFGLTRRELEVVVEVVAGASNPEIAHTLTISEQTVKHHLTHIFDKLGVYSRVELALFAVNHQLCETE